MGVAVRVIPCLDVDAGRVVKGVNFTDLRDAGDPVEMARIYDAEGADELTFLDVTASSGERETMYDVVRRTAEQVFIPLTVGGGIRTHRRRRPAAAGGRGQGRHQHRRGGPPRAAQRGQPAVRRAVHRAVGGRAAGAGGRLADAVRASRSPRTAGGAAPGSTRCEWAARGQERGVGRDPAQLDGRRRHPAGFDLEMIEAVRAVVEVPVVASGGAGAVGGLRARRSGPARTRCSRRASSTSGSCGSARSRTPCGPPIVEVR